MWHDLLSVQIPIVEKVLRTVAVYVVIVVLFRVSGKRDLSNLNTFDFVVIFLLSNVVQNAIIGADNSLLGGVIGAVTLVALSMLLNLLLARSERAVRLLEGTPTTIIEHGRLRSSALRRLSLRPGDIEQAVREQNGEAISAIANGRLDTDGRLVMELERSEQGATRGDIDELRARLAAIEELLAARTERPTGA